MRSVIMAEKVQANDLLNTSTFFPSKVTQTNFVMPKVIFTYKLDGFKYKIKRVFLIRKRTLLLLIFLPLQHNNT